MVGMTRRKSSQRPLEKLDWLNKFLVLGATRAGLTQIEVGDRLRRLNHGAPSQATVNRWFNEARPTDGELKSLAEVLDIPPAMFTAVRLLEEARGGNMLTTTGSWQYMVNHPKVTTILMGGLTMILGVVPIRAVEDLSGKTILVSTLGPHLLTEIEGRLAELEGPDAPKVIGGLRASWLSSVSILISMGHRPGVRVRIWARDEELLKGDGDVGELAANDWIAIDGPPPYRPAPFRASFCGDERWASLVQPTMERLRDDDHLEEGELLWDSAWNRSSAKKRRLRDLLSEVLAGFDPKKLCP